jgi:hypothetical protein
MRFFPDANRFVGEQRLVAVSSINGHIIFASGAPTDAFVEGFWFVLEYTVLDGWIHVYYNQEGREVFRVQRQKEKSCRLKSFVASVITRFVG